PGRMAGPDRLGAAAPAPVRRHGGRQHRPGPARRKPRGDRARRRPGRRGGVHRRAARRPGHRAGRAGRAPVGGGAPTDRARPRQRIALARAFLRDAPLLLLDEPTAHLDAITAAEILATIETLMGQRTVVLVSHGPGWAGQAGRTITLDHGKLAALVAV